MRFNNNLLLLASILGVASALRRGCRPEQGNTGLGFYTIVGSDTLGVVAADFCTDSPNLLNYNSGVSFVPGAFYKVPCRARTRDCGRIKGSENGYYTIVSGDQLRFIAEDFCTTVAELQRMNSDLIKNPDSIQAGWIIQVPCSWNQAPN
ncbi:hypothetical protein LZ554_000356 [Drepanopeziza brunnea f. sp. 'monogermtubi']|nr:hypothetical protein LZ554_000356 [Drepanopeziza brunnea f. sp. 'monogermtubi']